MNKNEVLATVGPREITQKDVENLINHLDPRTASQFTSEDGKKTLLQELINQELVYLDALDKGMDNDEIYKIEAEKAKENVLKQYAINTILSTVTVSEEEIEGMYENNKSSFVNPGSVRANHILVDTMEKANEISNQIKAGKSFEAAAKEYSSCPSAEQGGDLGFFTRGRMVPEFEEAAFQMDKGEISGPVKTQFGYHLIQVTDKKGESIKSLDEVRGQLKNQILAQKQQDAYHAAINELKGKYEVKIK